MDAIKQVSLFRPTADLTYPSMPIREERFGLRPATGLTSAVIAANTDTPFHSA
jgi:hypothetical protein